MPQSRLPDINTAFIKHRNEAIAALKSGNYEAAIGSIYAWNGLLPDALDDDGNPKYRIVISDIEYEKLTKPSVNVFCYECDKDDKKPLLYENITIFDVLLPFIDQCVTGSKTMKGWVCPNCNKVNLLDKTRELDKIVETTHKEPHFTRVLPSPPKRRTGLIDRISYDKKTLRWCYTAIAELDAISAQFRDDNWQKGGELYESDEFEEGGGEAEFETD